MKLVMKIIITICSYLISLKAYSIIGGQEVNDYHQFPLSYSTVALQLKYIEDDGTISYYKGTGVLIKDDVVLTAGHNVFYQRRPEDIEVIFSNRPCCGENVCNEIRILAEKKLIHPDFSMNYPNPPENDLALLKLRTKVSQPFRP